MGFHWATIVTPAPTSTKVVSNYCLAARQGSANRSSSHVWITFVPLLQSSTIPVLPKILVWIPLYPLWTSWLIWVDLIWFDLIWIDWLIAFLYCAHTWGAHTRYCWPSSNRSERVLAPLWKWMWLCTGRSQITLSDIIIIIQYYYPITGI